MSIAFETNGTRGFLDWDPFWPAGKDDTPENDHGHVTFSGCNLSDPTWLRIHIGNSTTNYFESFFWSDVGCRVTYDLNYHGPGNLTMVVSGMDPTIEQRDDLPHP